MARRRSNRKNIRRSKSRRKRRSKSRRRSRRSRTTRRKRKSKSRRLRGGSNYSVPIYSIYTISPSGEEKFKKLQKGDKQWSSWEDLQRDYPVIKGLNDAGIHQYRDTHNDQWFPADSLYRRKNYFIEVWEGPNRTIKRSFPRRQTHLGSAAMVRWNDRNKKIIQLIKEDEFRELTKDWSYQDYDTAKRLRREYQETRPTLRTLPVKPQSPPFLGIKNTYGMKQPTRGFIRPKNRF